MNMCKHENKSKTRRTCVDCMARFPEAVTVKVNGPDTGSVWEWREQAAECAGAVGILGAVIGLFWVAIQML